MTSHRSTYPVQCVAAVGAFAGARLSVVYDVCEQVVHGIAGGGGAVWRQVLGEIDRLKTAAAASAAGSNPGTGGGFCRREVRVSGSETERAVCLPRVLQIPAAIPGNLPRVLHSDSRGYSRESTPCSSL